MNAVVSSTRVILPNIKRLKYDFHVNALVFSFKKSGKR